MIDVQLHLWPWSAGIREETVDLKSGSASFPFWGSPVVSVSSEAVLFLPQRHEKFVPFGPLYEIVGGKFQLYETPHGLLASRHSAAANRDSAIKVRTNTSIETVRLYPEGTKERLIQRGTEEKAEESKLARIVLAWSQLFDDLVEMTRKTKRENKMLWSELRKVIFNISKDVDEPRMALIVDIAKRMHSRVPIVVKSARKILHRERRMLSAGRVSETDSVCLRWYIRQPGDTMAQKASANRQQLLGIARRESFDTLENRVLKDFLFRCATEGNRYLKSEVVSEPRYQNSERAREVREFRHLCNTLRQVPHLMRVALPPPGLRPNYVLQNDHRYKEIWRQYVRLLRREDEEDRLWDWQARTWADVSRVLVNVALVRMSNKADGQRRSEFILEELAASALHLLVEQKLGSRIMAGSEPGPFVIRRHGKTRHMASILEIVHSDQAGKHPATRLLGRLGGHQYLVLTPLRGGRVKVVVMWAVHTAAAKNHPPWLEIGGAAGRALQYYSRALDERREPDLPILKGFILCSDTETNSTELHLGGADGLHLLQVASDERYWFDTIAGIEAVVEDILEEVI